MKLPKLAFLTRIRLARAVRRESERGDRLEIDLRQLRLRQDALAGDLLRLSERLSKAEGRAAGRPPRAAPAPAQLPLEQIPAGDKPALRRALGIGLVKTTSPQE